MLVPLLAGILPLYIVRFSLVGIPTTLFEVAVWVVGCIYLVIPSLRSQLIVALRSIPRSYWVWISFFLLSACISTWISEVHRSSLGILKGWVITPFVFGLLVYAAQYKKPWIREYIVQALIVSGIVVALLGISQINGFTRIHSIYDVPNSLALFLVPIAVLSIWIGIKEKKKPYALAAIPMFVAILATGSLGAIIALLCTVLFAAFYTEWEEVRKWVPWCILGLLVVVGYLIFSGRFSYFLSPLTSLSQSNSATVRLQLWNLGARLIKKNPVLGVGLGQFEPAYQTELHNLFEQESRGVRTAGYALQPEYVFRDPHNWIISFWLNTGILGLISFVALNLFPLKQWRKARTVKDQALILTIIAMLLSGLVDTIYWKNDLSALWWMIIMARPLDSKDDL
jgi:putative inorganic carbon (HCO3(-)) transporter